MIDEQIEQVDKAVDVGQKAAKSVENVPIGWMFVIMICVIAITTFVSYNIIKASFENRITDLQTRIEDLKIEKKECELKSESRTQDLLNELRLIKNKAENIDVKADTVLEIAEQNNFKYNQSKKILKNAIPK